MAIRNPRAIHPMNQIVDRLTHKCPIHDVDCIYRNPRRDFWMAFEWKFPGERPGTSSTQRSIQELDVAFSCTDHTYRGFFIVQIGTSLDAGFDFDDTQQMAVVHLHHGEIRQQKTYPNNAETALKYLLDYGRLL